MESYHIAVAMVAVMTVMPVMTGMTAKTALAVAVLAVAVVVLVLAAVTVVALVWAEVPYVIALVARVPMMAGVWTEVPYKDDIRILPRASLIQALQENLETLFFEMDAEKWDHFAKLLPKKLDAVIKELKFGEISEVGFDRIMKIIDTKLVHFLRRDDVGPGVASILGRYLPRAGKKWDLFLKHKDSKEQDLFNAEKVADLDLKRKLKDGLQGCIEELKSNLERSSLNRKLSHGRRTYYIVKIFHATDRRFTTDGMYTSELASSQEMLPLQYGWVEVGIDVHAAETDPWSKEWPDEYRRSRRQFPSRDVHEPDPFDHLVIFAVNATPRDDSKQFLKLVKDGSETVDNDFSELLIFIHGCNASFLTAAKRAAQLKYDLGFQGKLILYSWSATDNLSGYYQDKDNVKSTTNSLKNFLKIILTEVQFKRVHILAHSMGCQAFIRALCNLEEDISRIPLSQSQIILVATEEDIFVRRDEELSPYDMLLEKLNKSSTSTMSASAADLDRATGSIGSSDLPANKIHLQPGLTVYRLEHSWRKEEWRLLASILVHCPKRSDRKQSKKAFKLLAFPQVSGGNEILGVYDVGFYGLELVRICVQLIHQSLLKLKVTEDTFTPLLYHTALPETILQICKLIGIGRDGKKGQYECNEEP